MKLQGENIPLNGVCCTEGVVYQAEVTEQSGLSIGYTERTFKSSNLEKLRYNTKLADYVWKSKEKYGKILNIKWRILRKVQAGRSSGSSCRLCHEEKLAITTYKNSYMLLNERREILSKCRHLIRKMLDSYNPG